MNSTIQIWQIKNLINDLDIVKLKDGKGIEISQYTTSSVTLELNASSLLKGQIVTLFGDFYINQEKHPFEAVGKVMKSTPLSEGLFQVEFQLKQIQKNIWNQFLESKLSSQSKVDALLKKIKGEI